MFTRLTKTVLCTLTLSLPLLAQSTDCRDIADEPNHHILYQNQNVRIFQLDLPRLKTTEAFCVAHPYVRIAATDGRIADLIDGGASFALDWKAGEARYIYEPKKKSIRNDLGSPYREYIFETLRTVQYNPLDRNTDADILAGDLGEMKPTWSLSASRGALTITKTQLAAGDSIALGTPDHYFIALTATDLSLTGPRKATDLIFSPSESERLSGGMERELKNQGHVAARFVIVEF